MKLSLAWIFDHIDADWQSVDVSELVTRFNTRVAEIEGFERFDVPLAQLALARVTDVASGTVELHCPACERTVSLPARADAVVGSWYLLTKAGREYAWASLRDCGATKDGLVPAVHVASDDAVRGWRESVEAYDYVLEVDNKSITHRPDLWGHRGFAREIAAILDLPFSAEKKLLISRPVRHQAAKVAANDGGFSVAIEAPQACRRFTGLQITRVANQACDLRALLRLARLEQRPIDALVDATNYVMLDVGQPLHAFDAAHLPDKNLVPRMARQGEKLAVLDGDTLELTADDLVITDGRMPIALAGVMGGAESAVGAKTTSLFVEAATFDPTCIRLTAARHKKRTESSARFEKGLDPNLPVVALQRLLAVLKAWGIKHTAGKEIISAGTAAQPQVIEVAHEVFERKLGLPLAQTAVVSALEKIGCTVTVGKQATYKIQVPTLRISRQPVIAEDLVEEVGRLHGFNKIPLILPRFRMRAADTQAMMRTRQIKHLCAYALQLHEVQNYALFDESFLRALGWEPEQTLAVQSPVSKNHVRLVTSLIPHLLKNVANNATRHEQLRFFELTRVWDLDERRCLSGIIAHSKQPVDFYAGKAAVEQLLRALGLTVSWRKAVAKDGAPWFEQHRTAELVHDDKLLGRAGTVNSSFCASIFEGGAFAFELDADYLLQVELPIKRFAPLHKYQDVAHDVSMLVPLTTTVGQALETIKHVDTRIFDAQLIDFFEDKKWPDQRSITIRYRMADQHKTMDRAEIDAVHKAVVAAVQQLGVTVR